MMERDLPRGWTQVTLGEIVTLKNGFAFNSRDYKKKGVPIIRISDIRDDKISLEKSVKVEQSSKMAEFIVERGDILIAMSGATTGKTGIFNESEIAYQNQRVGNIRPIHPQLVSREFIYHLIAFLRKEIEGLAYGGAQPNISAKEIGSITTKLPPLAEQKRIVAKLDAAFAHLEKMKVSLARIPELLKRFREAVLTQAVTGKLTEEWREGKGNIEWEARKLNSNIISLPADWAVKTCDKLGQHKLGKMLDQAKNEGERTFYLRNVNVRWFRFDLSDLAMMKANDSDRIKFDVKNGDLFVCEGGEPGRAAVWDNGENELIFQKALHRIRFNSDVNPYWFLYNLNSASISGVLKTLFTGTGIMHLTLKSLSKFEVPIPKLEEQKEIVRIVEYLFSIADAIESQYHVLKQKIDNLPQALLAKAFRGELVPQDPDDEPAAVLLEKIRNEMGKLGKKGKKQGVFDLVEG